MPFKVVVNKCYGGPALSRKAVLLGREISGDPNWCPESIVGDVFENGTIVDTEYGFFDMDRHDPILVKVVETLGDDASNQSSDLQIEIIDCNMYMIENYDGYETVVTPGIQNWNIIDEELEIE